eukprot:TRINITY_DN10130_c0_g4_i1.p1 TRINITY_DN10130_c0_g4~~TRINITY_DN10130_c0_g4_i1.p1  ORF type:complete len:362 (-),score=34.69 TRINITY_DN10130_c0_g4_i1:205-1290(-)
MFKILNKGTFVSKLVGCQFSTVNQPLNSSCEELVSLTRLCAMCTNVNQDLIIQNQNFILNQITNRGRSHIDRCNQYGNELQQYTQELDEITKISNMREMVASKNQGKKFISDLEFLNRKHQSQYEIASRSPKYWQNQQLIQRTNQILDELNTFLTTVRILVQQHMSAMDVMDLKVDENKVNLVAKDCKVYNLIRGVIEDCMAFSVEKNSTSPTVEITGDKDLTVSALDSFVAFILAETLKNAMQAVVKRYGAWDVDEADPIQLHLKSLQDTFEISIMDTGGGINGQVMRNMHAYYYTTVQHDTSKFGYSRNHGSKIEGIGVGIPLAKLYCRLMWGEMEWDVNLERLETKVTIKLSNIGFSF